MPVVITGDMTKEEADEAMIEDLRQQVATGATTLSIDQAQATRLLELLDAAGGGKAKATPAVPKAAVVEEDDDDEEDEKPKPRRR